MRILFQYAVKFVCGKSNGEVVAPGEYWTAINVHNPTSTDVKFRKKIAIGLPSERPGPVSKFFDAILGPDEALEIDRKDIFKHADTNLDFIKGFVVIESDVELDVVAVYTAAGREQQVETIHTERVPPRKIESGLPDLIPVPNEHGSFCKTKDNTLVVTIRNQGTAGAGPSTTIVDFFRYGIVAMPTPPLTPGASVDLPFTIPIGCHDPDCEFKITVDANNDVAESDEGNNIASDTCVG
jgi:subtilase family serine protease